MKFIVHNKAHSKAIQEKLFELGYRWSQSGNNVSYTGMERLYTTDGSCIFGGARCGVADASPRYRLTTLDELYGMSGPVKIKLNDKYEAEIDLDSGEVVVGCQRIPFNAIKELYLAIENELKQD